MNGPVPTGCLRLKSGRLRERPAVHQVAREDPGVVAQQGKEGGERGAEGEAHRERVDHLDAPDRGEVGAQARARGDVQDLVEGELDVVGAEWGAVVPGDTAPQREGGHEPVLARRPRLGQVGRGTQGGVGAYESRKEDLVHHHRPDVGSDHRVEDGVVDHGDAQHAAVPRGLAALGRSAAPASGEGRDGGGDGAANDPEQPAPDHAMASSTSRRASRSAATSRFCPRVRCVRRKPSWCASMPGASSAGARSGSGGVVSAGSWKKAGPRV